MKATDLQDTIRFFDPQRPLSDEELREWYVPRPHSLQGHLRILLETGRASKMLFTGQRRSGTTTELNKLLTDLNQDFYALFFDVQGHIGRDSLNPKGLIAALTSWLADRSFEEAIWTDLNELIRSIEDTFGGKRLLIVIDGLEKIDLDTARGLFGGDVSALLVPRMSIIYTFPLALWHSEDIDSISRNFDGADCLPNIRTHHLDGRNDDEGREWLRRLILVRMEEELIEPDAMEFLIEMSGGLPMWLMAVTRGAARYALERSSEQIARTDAENAVRDLHSHLGRLSLEDHEILRARHAARRLNASPEEERLLENGSLIEYPGDPPWCDAHPVLWPLLEHDNGSFASPEGEAEAREALSPVKVYIRSLELQNLKGIHQAHFEMAGTVEEAPGWFVLAGGNGSGKSTLLRSLALAMLGRPANRFTDGSWIQRGAESAGISIDFLTGNGSEAELRSRIGIQSDGALEIERDITTEEILGPAFYFSGYGPFKRLEGGSDHARDLTRSDRTFPGLSRGRRRRVRNDRDPRFRSA